MRKCLLVVCVSALMWPTPRAPADDARSKPAIYDSNARASNDIAAAVQRSARRNTRVLLMFGANWCSWCHRLHDLFESDTAIRKALSYEYELVMVDADKGRNTDVVERYGNPVQHGLPVLVVLDGNGKQLCTQETGSLEQGEGHDPAKVLAFLNEHRATPLDANEVVKAGLADAGRTQRKAFIYFTAPWCSWCHRLEDYLADAEVATVLDPVFVPIRIDTDRMRGGKEAMLRLRGGEDESIPFFIIAAKDGARLADANGAKGNVGFPVETFEVEHFMATMRAQAPSLSEEQFELLAQKLKAFAPPSDRH